ncbi:MAG TPA: rod shape-determining protein MreC [Clostridiales bacterium]|nr:rod shape-determining protein MreC [Clostridiales bacterium]
MSQFIKRWPLVIVIILAILLLVLIILTSGQRDKLSSMEGLVGEFITLVQEFLYKLVTNITKFFSSFRERRQLVQEYELLKERLVLLEQQQLEMDEVLRENQRLKRLLDFKQENNPIMVAGVQITGKNPGNWFNTMTIDCGSDQGVSVNMAMVNDQGLIGRVTEVSSNWAKVRAIVDGQSSISAIVERTRDNGMIKGNNTFTTEDGLCQMINLPLDSDIVVGDRIITSGLGEIFPKGIPIGEVIEVVDEKREKYITAIVQPAVDFQRLEEGLVVGSHDN